MIHLHSVQKLSGDSKSGFLPASHAPIDPVTLKVIREAAMPTTDVESEGARTEFRVVIEGVRLPETVRKQIDQAIRSAVLEVFIRLAEAGQPVRHMQVDAAGLEGGSHDIVIRAE
jgi:hypothetical protein